MGAVGVFERQFGFDKTFRLSGSEERGRFRELCSVLLDDEESLLHGSVVSRSSWCNVRTVTPRSLANSWMRKVLMGLTYNS